jgi:hypothetical protein
MPTSMPRSLTLTNTVTASSILSPSFAGNVGLSNVDKMVESTDTCVSARHVADMSANMSATQPKTVSDKELTMSRQHVAYGYVGNMSAGNLLTEILLLHVFNISTPLCHYTITPVCQYAITPLSHYAITPVCQYASMPVCQYTITPLCHYASMSVRQYASTPVRQYASRCTPVDVRQ